MDKYGYEPEPDQPSVKTAVEREKCPVCGRQLVGQPPVCPRCGSLPFEPHKEKQ